MHVVERYQLTDSPYFYHGTLADYLPSILKWGLIPNLHSAYTDELVPMAGYTYLSADLRTAELFAGANFNCKWMSKEFIDHPEIQASIRQRYTGGVVVRIDSRYLAHENFCADEDSLVFGEQGGQKAWQHFGLARPGDCYGVWGKGKLHEARLVDYSLSSVGSLAYRGPIPAASLKLYKQIKRPPYRFSSSFAFTAKRSA